MTDPDASALHDVLQRLYEHTRHDLASHAPKCHAAPHLASHGGSWPGQRAWVIRCSSGEEPHSLAIAFAEVREARPDLPACELQIFANGLNADAIAAAHSGRFASTIARDLTPQRLTRHFTKGADVFVIDKRIRDSVLSAQHDVILDPAFTRLDLRSCRKLLIYFSAAPQRRLPASGRNGRWP